jgi:regulation of enolase protein 1 (concanavalin A-like superfamily)
MTLRSIRGFLVLFCISLLSSVHEVPVAGQSAGPRPNFKVLRTPELTAVPIPGDFSEDGRMDVVASRPLEFTTPLSSVVTGGELVIRLGNGDGTFAAEQIIATPGMAVPLAIGDFNADGNLDVVALERRNAEDTLRHVWIIPGNGDGTFGSAIHVDSHPVPHPLSADQVTAVADNFDGDAHLDLALIVKPDQLHIYPGNGDLSFDARVTLTTGASPSDLMSADLNGDGRRDIAVAARDGQQVDVFLNQGGFLYGLSSIPLDRAALAVAPADLNRDGRTDLIVGAATEDFDFRGTFHDGRVMVLMGNGDGTFQSPVAYETPRGTNAILSGDFNRDGLPDVAAANQTAGDEEECGPLWGSVSILRGNGAGVLGPAANFQLAYDQDWPGLNDWVVSLYAAPIDGDTHLDLITAGAVLLNRTAAANRPPTANAGPDQTIGTNQSMSLKGEASDPDNDYLTYTWTDESGRIIERCLVPGSMNSPPGEHTYTLTVSDGRGGTATDSLTIVNHSTNSFPNFDIYRPWSDRPVPAYAPYSIQFSADPEQIVDIDISVDRNGQNNFTPIPNCTNLPGTATECIWPDPGPPSDNAALFFRITDSQGRVSNTVQIFQIVDGPRGALPAGWSNADVGAVGAPGAAGYDGARVFTVRGSGADIWGTADEFHWAYTSVGGDFEVVGRVATVQHVHDWTKAGLMIREGPAPGARHASIFATPGTVKPVSFQRRPTVNGESVHTAGAVTAPPVWLKLQRTGLLVTASYRTGPADAWIEIDSQVLPGLAHALLVGLPVSSHVDGVSATASFDNVVISSNSAPRLAVLRPEAGEQVQTQASYTIRWMLENSSAGIARYDVFFTHDPTVGWFAIPECTNLSANLSSCIWKRPGLTGPAYIKVVATSVDGIQGVAFSEQFQITTNVHGPGGTPPGWTCGDIGAVGAPGSCTYQVDDELSPDFIIEGAGADMWGAADEFSHASYRAYGNFSFTARVQWVDNIHRWTKAGLMIRDSSGQTPDRADDRHASFFVTPTTEKGTAFQRRPVEGGESIHTAGPVTTGPVWLKLVRTNNTIRAYYRKEWVNPWTLLGEQVFDQLPYQLDAMLVVSSHVDGTLARASFDNVIIDEQKPMESMSIGATTPGRTSSNGVETILEGNGADIWGTADAFHYHYMRWNGYGTITVRVRSLEDTHAWSKAGVMFRETLAPDSKHVMAIVSSSRGIAMQSRSTTGGASVSTVPVMVNAPVWLTLRRYDDTFTASWSQDGETWFFLGQVTVPMAADIFVGLPVTSHAAGTLASAVFDDFFIQSR